MAKYQRVKKCSKSFRPLSGNLLSLLYFVTVTVDYQQSFRPLSGNLLSLPYEFQFMKDFIELFSSPIGESTFSTTCGMRIENLENLEFSSPIGESTFSTKFYKGIVKETYRFRPLSGNLLSLPHRKVPIRIRCRIFVPYRGIYFLYKITVYAQLYSDTIFVPYRGIYFLYRVYRHYDICSKHCPFSSPIGESTFSTRRSKMDSGKGNLFSSPIGESTFSTYRQD